MNLDTDLLVRLKANDSTAWFELWDVFGKTLERMIRAICQREAVRFGNETIRDVSQDTLRRLYQSIGTFDAQRGTKFSTWLYSIARNVVHTELSYRSAKKRNEGRAPTSIDSLEGFEVSDHGAATPEFERSIFRAKLLKAMRDVRERVELLEFEAYQMKISEDLQSKDIADQLGVSESSISRYLKRTRSALREEIARAVAIYSWTEDEEAESDEAGLSRDDDEAFDQSLAALVMAPDYDASEANDQFEAGITKSAASFDPSALLGGKHG